MSQCCSEIEGAFLVNSFADVRPHQSVVTVANEAVAMPLQIRHGTSANIHQCVMCAYIVLHQAYVCGNGCVIQHKHGLWASSRNTSKQWSVLAVCPVNVFWACYLGSISASIANTTIGSKQYPSKQQQLYSPRCCASGLSAPAMLFTTSQTTRLLTTLHPSITPKCSLPACSEQGTVQRCTHGAASLCMSCGAHWPEHELICTDIAASIAQDSWLQTVAICQIWSDCTTLHKVHCRVGEATYQQVYARQ